MTLCITEFDEETAKTRGTLERVPTDKADYRPHEKSMPLGKLAAHVVQLTSFGLTVLTTAQLDFPAGIYKPLPFESARQLVNMLDEGAAKVRTALVNTTDDA